MNTHIYHVQNVFFILEKEKSSTQNFYIAKIEVKTPRFHGKTITMLLESAKNRNIPCSMYFQIKIKNQKQTQMNKKGNKAVKRTDNRIRK